MNSLIPFITITPFTLLAVLLVLLLLIFLLVAAFTAKNQVLKYTAIIFWLVVLGVIIFIEVGIVRGM